MNGTRRRALQTIVVATGSVVGLAGCLENPLAASDVVDETHSVTGGELRSPEQTTTRIGESIDDYGEHGVWGTAMAEPDHRLELVGGGYAETVDEGSLETDHLLAVYENPARAGDGTRTYNLWFWSGVRPTDDGPTIERLETGVALSTDRFSMGQYAPAGDAGRDGSAAIGIAAFDVATPRVEFPTAGGTVAPRAEGTGVGDGGGFHATWTGETTSTQSLLATCEIEGPGLEALEFDWTTVVAVDG